MTSSSQRVHLDNVNKNQARFVSEKLVETEKPASRYSSETTVVVQHVAAVTLRKEVWEAMGRPLTLTVTAVSA